MPNEGVNRLARVLEERRRQTGSLPPIIDFGSIQSDRSLVTNNFPVPIPASDYLVISSAVDTIQPESRVLVAWVGDDACVIGGIIPASNIEEGA